MPSGYSGTPLLNKLGIKAGYQLLLLNAPDNYLELLGDLPEDCSILESSSDSPADFIHLFCQTMESLALQAPLAKAALKKDGMLWISWPKGKSSIPTDLKRDPIRTFLLDLGLVDVKVAAVDEDWSGLKFVYRLKDR